jgi:hypothetical protein
MRRSTTLAALACLSAAAFPAAALADHGDGHHGDDHGHHHHGQRFHDQDRGRADIGKVTSFDGHTLTIAFTDGDTLTAAVGRRTEIECESMGDVRDHDRGPGGGDNGRDDGQNCDRLLSAGTSVTEARLDETDAGAFWDEVALDAGVSHHHA